MWPTTRIKTTDIPISIVFINVFGEKNSNTTGSSSLLFWKCRRCDILSISWFFFSTLQRDSALINKTYQRTRYDNISIPSTCSGRINFIQRPPARFSIIIKQIVIYLFIFNQIQININDTRNVFVIRIAGSRMKKKTTEFYYLHYLGGYRDVGVYLRGTPCILTRRVIAVGVESFLTLLLFFIIFLSVNATTQYYEHIF